MNSISFSRHRLYKLTYIEKGNQLSNFDDFTNNEIGKDRILNLFELWKFANNLVNRSLEYSSFLHELKTCLLNCKLWENSTNFGFKYGSLALTTYQNNSIPNLIEISIVFPDYSDSPIK